MKKVIIICSIIVVVAILYFSFMFLFYGTPWGKARALRQAKDYLNKTYTQSMIVNDVTFDVNGDTYIVDVSPESNKSIKFFVYIDRKGKVWKDKYYLEFFSYELGKEANKYAKELFGEENRAYALINGETLKSYNIKNLNENTRLEDVIDKFNGKYYFGIVINREFPVFNYNEDAQKMLKFINYAKSLECKPNEISFAYYKANNTSSSFRLSIDEKEYQKIISIDDLLSYIQKKIDSKNAE